MLHRPQRTEAAQRLEARTVRTFAAPLRAGVSSNNCPARSRRKPPWAEARARGVPQLLFSQPQHSECATQRHGACGAAMHAACARPRCCLSALSPQGDGGGGSCPARSEAEAARRLLGKRGCAEARR